MYSLNLSKQCPAPSAVFFSSLPLFSYLSLPRLVLPLPFRNWSPHMPFHSHLPCTCLARAFSHISPLPHYPATSHTWRPSLHTAGFLPPALRGGDFTHLLWLLYTPVPAPCHPHACLPYPCTLPHMPPLSYLPHLPLSCHVHTPAIARLHTQHHSSLYYACLLQPPTLQFASCVERKEFPSTHAGRPHPLQYAFPSILHHTHAHTLCPIFTFHFCWVDGVNKGQFAILHPYGKALTPFHYLSIIFSRKEGPLCLPPPQ